MSDIIFVFQMQDVNLKGQMSEIKPFMSDVLCQISDISYQIANIRCHISDSYIRCKMSDVTADMFVYVS